MVGNLEKVANLERNSLSQPSSQPPTLDCMLERLTDLLFQMQEQSYRFEKLHIGLTGERALPPEQPVPCASASDAKRPHFEIFAHLLNRYEQLANEQQLILDALNRHI